MDYSLPVLIVLCTAIVQAMKAVNIPTAWLPFVSMVVGVCLSFLAGTAIEASQAILDGMVIGLAGSGLFDFAKLSVGGVVRSLTK